MRAESGSTWYSYRTALELAFDSVRAHKLRSFLTLLGVIIGVASVVIVGSAIGGLGTYAASSTAKAFGTDTYLVGKVLSAGPLSRKELAEKLRRNKDLKPEEVEYLRSATGDDIIYTPYVQRQVNEVTAGNQRVELTSIIGASANMPDIREVIVVEGRFFTEQEELYKQAVAVIGDEVKSTLFPGGQALGQTIKIQGLDFRIVGVQEKMGSSFGNNLDNNVYIPAGLWFKIFGTPSSISIFGRPRDLKAMSLDDGLDVTRMALRSRFKTRPGAVDNFDTLTPDAIRGFVDQILGVISAIVVPVTCISLVVGGIVIMNIMLVSVTERTREIGVRKSLGARHSDIQRQVLMEAMILSVAGGALGLLLAWVLTKVLSAAFGTELNIPGFYVFLAVFVSTAVGMISGWYPAMRAAKLDPVVALRSE